MSQYVHGSMPYNKYLQLKSIEDGIRWDIRDSALKVGASLDALKESGVRVEKAIGSASTAIQGAVRAEGAATRQALDGGFARVEAGMERGFQQVGEGLDRIDASIDRVDDTLQAGFIRLHFDLEDVQSSLTDMSAKFDYGFAQLSTQLGSIKDTLEELKLIAKNPEQTWAFEQFEIARDAFRRGLFEESLLFVTRAIDGHQSHTGYMLEHRFHHFLGALRLGDYRNHSADVLDLALAEKAFVNAARYAQATYPKDAARSLCSAGFTAYVQGNGAAAFQHTQNALRLHAELPEGHFQLAKLSFHANEIEQGLGPLWEAIRRDHLYAVRCFADDDFARHEQHLSKFLTYKSAEIQGLTAESCGRALALTKSTRESTLATAAEITKSVSAFKGATPGTGYEIRLPDTGEPFRRCEAALTGAIESAKRAVPFMDAIAVSRKGDVARQDAATTARQLQEAVDMEVHRDRVNVTAPQLFLPDFASIQAKKEQESYTTSKGVRTSRAIAWIIAGLILPVAILIEITAKGGRIGYALIEAVLPTLIFITLPLGLVAKSYLYGRLGERAEANRHANNVAKIKADLAAQRKQLERTHSDAGVARSALITANSQFDESTKKQMSALAQKLRQAAKEIDSA